MKLPTSISKLLFVSFMVFLIGFPSIYKAMHQVFSSHHHFECCDHNDDNDIHNTEETCFIVQFDFVTQFQHNADPYLKSLIAIKRKYSAFVTVSYSDNACFTASSRAPPIS